VTIRDYAWRVFRSEISAARQHRCNAHLALTAVILFATVLSPACCNAAEEAGMLPLKTSRDLLSAHRGPIISNRSQLSARGSMRDLMRTWLPLFETADVIEQVLGHPDCCEEYLFGAFVMKYQFGPPGNSETWYFVVAGGMIVGVSY